MAIIAVDPGFANMGVVIADPGHKVALSGGTFRVRFDGENDSRTVQRIWEVLDGVFAASAIPPVRGVVETQCMGQLLRGVEFAALAWMQMREIPCVAAHPMTLKSSVTGLGTRGHRQNKKDAEQIVKDWGYNGCNNHEADCIIMCEWANLQPEHLFIGKSFLN